MNKFTPSLLKKYKATNIENYLTNKYLSKYKLKQNNSPNSKEFFFLKYYIYDF